MMKLSKIIEKHRKTVLNKQRKDVEKIQSKLRKATQKTKKVLKYQKQLSKEKAEYELAKRQLRQLRSLRNAPRREKIRKARYIAGVATKEFGKAGKLIGCTLRDLSRSLDKQSKSRTVQRRRRR